MDELRWEEGPHYAGVPPTLITFKKLDEMEEIWKTFKERKEDYGVVVTQVQIRKPLLMFARFVDDQFEQIGIDSCNAFWWKLKRKTLNFIF